MTRRSITEAEEAKLKFGNQKPIDDKAKLVDFLIENSRTLAQLEEASVRTLNLFVKL